MTQEISFSPADPADGPRSAPLSRRSFLELLGFSLAAAGCQRSPVREAIPFVDKPEEMLPGEALWYATTCGGCTAGCPLLVKTRDGRPIKVEGNPDAALTGGGTCAVGQATVLGVYDQTRLAGPLWHGEAVDWAEADARIGDRLGAIAAAGHDVVLLTGTLTSPTARRLVDEWCGHFPSSRHVSYDPVSAAGLRRAYAEGYGKALVPHYRFERARAVVALEADFLGTWLSPVEFVRGYTSARRLDATATSPASSWHAQFESRLSVTGSNADLRVPVRPSDVGRVALELYARIARRAGAAPMAMAAATSIDPAPLDEAAEALWTARGESLVVCGLNDSRVQLVVAGINDLLGNVGSTIDLDRPSAQRLGDEGDLATLVGEMQAGRVHGLIVWGVNPVYDTPLGTSFAEGLRQVALSVSLADRRDETAALVDAVAPDHHALESWNDAEPVGGRRSLAQPTLAPLFDTRAAPASLLRWMGRDADWHGYLRETWRRELFPRQSVDTDFERFWERSVHDGVVAVVEPESAGPARWRFAGDLETAAAAVARQASDAADEHAAGGLELALYEKVGLRDGRQANNPWLLELPDPVSRVAWNNYAALAPALAERLGLEDGDVVRLAKNGHSVEVPVLRQPGQAPDTVAVALGYGRRRAGRAADGVGVDVYPLVEHRDGLFRYDVTGVALELTGRREPLALAQRHASQEGRSIVRETTLASWRKNPASGNEDHHKPVRLWPERDSEGPRWGLAIDLNDCVGCSACVVACQVENNIPVVGPEEMRLGRGMHWIRVDRYYNPRGDAAVDEAPDVAFQPMMCQHCADAPCESVCPVLATVHSSDGLNQQVYNRCIGTRYCANNCPYKVRRFNWFNYAKNEQFDYHLNDDLGTLVLNPDVVVRSRGVMEKCSMCIQRIQLGKLQAKKANRPLADGEIRTACQEACPAGAIRFGDLEDAASQVARQSEDPRFYRVLEELNTRPGVGYLTRVRNRPEETV